MLSPEKAAWQASKAQKKPEASQSGGSSSWEFDASKDQVQTPHRISQRRERLSGTGASILKASDCPGRRF